MRYLKICLLTSLIGLYLDDIESLDVEQDVEIIYDNEFFRAHVCHVEAQHDGGYLVGFDCDRAERP